MSRFPRYSLIFAAFGAMTLLAISARKHPTGPASSTRPINDWDIADLAIHLNRMGVEVRLRSVPRKGPINHSAFLTSTAKEWHELNVLNKNPHRIQEWEGTVYCERIGDRDPAYLIEQWTNHYLIVGPFIFYGDADLLERVRSALVEFAPSIDP